MRAVFNFFYLLTAYSIGSASAYFAFYSKGFEWSRFAAYALGVVAAIMIVNGEKLVSDSHKDTALTSVLSKISTVMIVLGLSAAFFGLFVVDVKIFGEISISMTGWIVVFCSLIIGATGKFLRELSNG